MCFRLALMISVAQIQAEPAEVDPVALEVKSLQGRWTWVKVDVGDGWTVHPTALADYGEVVVRDDVITFGLKGGEAKMEVHD